MFSEDEALKIIDIPIFLTILYILFHCSLGYDLKSFRLRLIGEA